MFAPRYFGVRHFAPRYYAPGTDIGEVLPPPVEGVFDIPRGGPGAFIYDDRSLDQIIAHEDEILLVTLAAFLGQVNDEEEPVHVTFD